jgi:CBS domain-containing protein
MKIRWKGPAPIPPPKGARGKKRAATATVSTVMARNLVTVSIDDSCRWALMVMRAARVSRLPVLDGERMVGILTRGDIHRRMPLDVSPANVRVAGLMTYAPIDLRPDMPVLDAARVLSRRGIGGAPVVENGRPVGILTRGDLLAFLLDASTPKPQRPSRHVPRSTRRDHSSDA